MIQAHDALEEQSNRTVSPDASMVFYRIWSLARAMVINHQLRRQAKALKYSPKSQNLPKDLTTIFGLAFFQMFALLAWLTFFTACQKTSPEQLIVFAASSLQDVFKKIAADFQVLHPETKIIFNFAGTQELRLQIEHGAPADVFASADRSHMDALLAAEAALSPELFARNEPVIVVSLEASKKIKHLEDLPLASRIVIGAPEVPIGRYSATILDRATSSFGRHFADRVKDKIVSKELSVRQILSKVKLGEADAGIVYLSDAQLSPELSKIKIPPEINVTAEYPIAVLTRSQRSVLARKWIDFVLSEAGQNTLRQAGFLSPSKK